MIRRTLVLLLAVGLLAPAACGGGPGAGEADVLDRQTFIDTVVDLRSAALENDGVLELRRKETILSEHGVTEDQLVRFAEVHGQEASYMLAVWDEVQRRLEGTDTTGDATGGRGR